MEQLKVGYARKMKLWTNRKLGTVIQSAMIVTLVRRVRLTHAYFPSLRTRECCFSYIQPSGRTAKLLKVLQTARMTTFYSVSLHKSTLAKWARTEPS